MSTESKSSSGGIGFFGLLGIAFIVLKLCKVINWSWLWVTVPLWGGFAILLALGIIYIAFKTPGYIAKKRRSQGVKKIMNDTGKNWYAALQQYNKENGIILPATKWQERLDEIQKRTS